MKAAVSERYGPPEVVEVRDVPAPQPGAGEVLVKVRASTVSRTDVGMRAPHPFFIRPVIGMFRPRTTILGMDFSGTVEAVGAGATKFAVGDRVFGLSPDTFGGHAEYLCVAEDGAIARVPEGVTVEDAVACEGSFYANSTAALIEPAEEAAADVMVYGASGAIGTAAVQLFKAKGANVTTVVGTRHVGLAASLGADRVIDYQREDFAAIPERFDLVLDAVGKTSYFQCRGLLKPGGTFAATDLGPWSSNLLLGLLFARSKRVIIPLPGDANTFVPMLAGLMEAGKFRGVFDRDYKLDNIVEAYRYVESEQKTGIVRLLMG